MVRSRRLRISGFDVFNACLLTLLCALCIYPMLYVLFASFSIPSRLSAHRGALLAPLGFTWKGYELVISNVNILSGYINTIIYVVAGTAFAVLVTLVAAYLTSRRRWQWASPLTMLIAVHMFFGGGIIPFYLLVRDLGLINTRWSLIIPGALSVWNMMVLKTAILGIPSSLEESAHMDGASDPVILFRILVPVLTSALAVQVLLYAVGIWNSWFNATLFIRDRALVPLQVILREILISNDMQSVAGTSTAGTADSNLYQQLTKYCTIIVSTLPIMLVYPFLQKYFVKGLMVGSIKG